LAHEINRRNNFNETDHFGDIPVIVVQTIRYWSPL